jgi:hypothetical protein
LYFGIASNKIKSKLTEKAPFWGGLKGKKRKYAPDCLVHCLAERTKMALALAMRAVASGGIRKQRCNQRIHRKSSTTESFEQIGTRNKIARHK